jgi:hypothetical protein
MAENNPSLPGGALPPRPSDSKVLPKKETVRINLPPKPSAAPTIKLPTLPPGGPSTAAAPAAPIQRTSVSGVPAAPATSAPRAAAAPASAATAQRPTQQRPLTRPAAAVSGLDKALAITAAVIGLLAVGTTVFLTFFINYKLP